MTSISLSGWGVRGAAAARATRVPADPVRGGLGRALRGGERGVRGRHEVARLCHHSLIVPGIFLLQIEAFYSESHLWNVFFISTTHSHHPILTWRTLLAIIVLWSWSDLLEVWRSQLHNKKFRSYYFRRQYRNTNLQYLPYNVHNL